MEASPLAKAGVIWKFPLLFMGDSTDLAFLCVLVNILHSLICAVDPTVYNTSDGCKGGPNVKFRGLCAWSIQMDHQVGPTPGAQHAH